MTTVGAPAYEWEAVERASAKWWVPVVAGSRWLHAVLGGLRHALFVNAATGRGDVIYHRDDGHYGLIAPD